MNEIIKFLNSKIRNIHLVANYYKLYVRKAHRIINGDIVKTFDIGTIEATKPMKGKLRPFLTKIEQIVAKTDYNIIYVENVLVNHLGRVLLEQCYSEIDNGGVPSYYKYITRKS